MILRRLTLGALLTLTFSNLDASRYRTFTSVDGRQIEAKVLSVENDIVTIERIEGWRYEIPLTRFTPEDIEYFLNWKPEGDGPDFTSINERLGIELFEDTNLWDDADHRVAQRLKWPSESKTEWQSSYRNYPDAESRILKARPYSQVLYGENGYAASVSLVFANQGDSVGLLAGRDGRDALDTAIKADAETIAASLSALLGEAVRQSYGEGSTHRRLSRWDWKGHAFLLSEEAEQYVGLRIEPSQLADLKGRPNRTRDSELRDAVAQNVRREANGDVLIRNIPMVDQGPKGYCVPATFERCMRYLGIPSDMYLLAVSGKTMAGGGTFMDVFIENVRSDITRNGRSLDRPNMDLAIRDIARYIDKGVPILWTHGTTPAFNEITNTLTKKRDGVTDWSDWAEVLDAYKQEGQNIRNLSSYAHIAMIIGYNAETGEVAVSDSWGPSYEVRWVPVEVAAKVTDGFYVIGI